MTMHATQHPTARKQRGLSLIELMIAMLLGIVLIGGVIQVFLASKQSNRLVNGLSQVQERGRFAVGFIQSKARMTGYMGCNSRLSQNHIVNLLPSPPDYGYDFAKPVQGFDNVATAPTAFAGLDHPPITPTLNAEKSDILSVRSVIGNNSTTTANVQSTDDIEVTNAKALNLQAGDALSLSDCTSATLFKASGVDTAGNTISHTDNIPKLFAAGATVSHIATVSYFVASKDGHADCSHHDCGLWRKTTGHQAQLLVFGIENLQVLYGVDTNGDRTPNQYVTAQKVTTNNNWDRVVALKVALLIASDQTALDKLPTTAVTFQIFGNTVAAPAADMLFRRVFTSTISLRDRTL